MFYCLYSVMTGRKRSSWCEWNSGIPRMSWTERCQGKNIDFNFNIQHIRCYYLFMWYNGLTFFFSFAQGGRGYSGEKVNVLISFFFFKFSLWNIPDYLTNCYHVAGWIWRNWTWWNQWRRCTCLLNYIFSFSSFIPIIFIKFSNILFSDNSKVIQYKDTNTWATKKKNSKQKLNYFYSSFR